MRAHDLASGATSTESASAEVKLDGALPACDGVELALRQAMTKATERLIVQIGFQR